MILYDQQLELSDLKANPKGNLPAFKPHLMACSVSPDSFEASFTVITSFIFPPPKIMRVIITLKGGDYMTRQEIDQLIMCFEKTPTKALTEILKNNISKRTVLNALINTTPALLEIQAGTIQGKNGEILPLFLSSERIELKVKNNGLIDSDVFRLSEFGQNQLYALLKEKEDKQNNKQSLRLSKIAILISIASLLHSIFGPVK